MKVQSFITDFFDSNIYLFDINKHKIMIDCGGTPSYIKRLLSANSFTPEYVLLTHGHFDHISSLVAVNETGAKVFIHKDDAKYLVDPEYNLSTKLTGDSFIWSNSVYDYDSLPMELGIEVIHVPGHSPGSVALKINNSLFTGDTLFCDGIGNTMFPGGNFETELDSVKKLLALPEDTIVYPGHGPTTTIAKEQNLII